MTKSAEELLSDPAPIVKENTPPAPISIVLDNLTVTEGKKLTILTRTNPKLANAAQIGFIYATMFNSNYVAGRVEMIEQLAISMDGKGREEQIGALQAGGKLPDSFFENGSSPDFDEAR